MRAAVGAGVDGLFIEVHPEPDRALCDGPNMIALSEIKELLKQAKSIHELVRTWGVV
jgi:2-dehydro-3-deoxyphosphooctonate aldolase (KDO 8-P synthase)